MTTVMKNRESRRQEVLERLATQVLRVGLPGSSLRPLAAAAGTSDRMLLYYFADKRELLEATLAVVAARLTSILADALPEPQPFEVLLARICELLTSPPLRPYMQLWLEVVGLAARGEEPFRSIAGSLCDGFLAWGASRLLVEAEEERPRQAARLLGSVEGLMLLDAIGRGAVVEAALQGSTKSAVR